MLSFPISLKEYFFGKLFGKLFSVTLPIIGALILALFWSILKGASVPWGIFFYYMALIVSINICFLGLSFFISSIVKTQEVALGIAFFVWLFLLALIDLLLIGFLIKTTASPELVYSIALANPLQVFRIGAIALFDPELSVIGPASAIAPILKTCKGFAKAIEYTSSGLAVVFIKKPIRSKSIKASKNNQTKKAIPKATS
jgi:ABC-2 type transport system permease protein